MRRSFAPAAALAASEADALRYLHRSCRARALGGVWWRCDERRIVRHAHKPFDFLLVLIAGQLDARVGSQRRRLRAGDAMLVPAGRHHGASLLGQRVEACTMHAELVDHGGRHALAGFEQALVTLPDWPQQRERLRRWHRLRSHDAATAMASGGALLVDLVEAQIHAGNRLHVPHDRDCDPRLDCVVRRMLLELDGDLSIEELAAEAGISAVALRRLFREHLGCSPSAYLTQLRLRRACELLAGTELPVAELARRCGLGSAHTLHRLFRQHMRCTPIDYRERRHPA